MEHDRSVYETQDAAEEAGKHDEAYRAAGGFVVRLMGDGSIRTASYERVREASEGGADPGGMVDPDTRTVSLHAYDDGAWRDAYLGIDDDHGYVR